MAYLNFLFGRPQNSKHCLTSGIANDGPGRVWAPPILGQAQVIKMAIACTVPSSMSARREQQRSAETSVYRDSTTTAHSASVQAQINFYRELGLIRQSHSQTPFFCGMSNFVQGGCKKIMFSQFAMLLNKEVRQLTLLECSQCLTSDLCLVRLLLFRLLSFRLLNVFTSICSSKVIQCK